MINVPKSTRFKVAFNSQDEMGKFVASIADGSGVTLALKNEKRNFVAVLADSRDQVAEFANHAGIVPSSIVEDRQYPKEQNTAIGF